MSPGLGKPLILNSSLDFQLLLVSSFSFRSSLTLCIYLTATLRMGREGNVIEVTHANMLSAICLRRISYAVFFVEHS